MRAISWRRYDEPRQLFLGGSHDSTSEFGKPKSLQEVASAPLLPINLLAPKAPADRKSG